MANQIASLGSASYTNGHSQNFLANERTDAWWLEPLLTACGFLCFVVYATWSALQGNHYFVGSYLSPFYSPVLFADPSALGSVPLHHAWFGAWPAWWPAFLPASPAILILAGPLSFRMTCYYYRKFYYRSFLASPVSCAVTALPLGKYRGESGLFLFQNIHRYTFYLAFAFILILSYDAAISFYRDGEWGIGVGSLVLTLNALFLAAYTCGCHAFRHLIGGCKNHFTCKGKPTGRFRLWQGVSCLNGNHMLWAWISMIWVGFSDAYVRLVSMGILTDWNTWGAS